MERLVRMLAVDDARGASTRYRVLAYRPALEAAGYRTEVRYALDAGRGGPARPVWRAVDLVQDLVEPAGSEILFVHRKTYPPPLARFLRRPRRWVVFDQDDALDLPPPGRPAGERTLSRFRRNFAATTEAADLVLCGNSELATRVPHDRTEILSTPVDTRRFSPHVLSPRTGKVLGWVGHSDNLAYLEDLAAPLRELARRHPDLRLVVVADRPPELTGLEVEFRPWRLEDEVSCFDGIGVGLMPLADSPWARCKCAFKAIQYMSLGIPAVASPVGMTRELIREGENGFLAASPGDWIDVLDRLLADRGLAASIGAAGRETVLREHSLEVNTRRLLSILNALSGAAGPL